MNKKLKTSQFIGRQLSRMKVGMSYVLLFVSTLTAISVLNIAFPEIETWIVFMLLPVVMFGSIFLGYIMDKSNITATDHMKTLEMTSRYINTADLKSYEFWMVIMKVFFKWMTSIQEGKPLDKDEIKKKYVKFLKKWSQLGEEK
ncbi:hypothetical protein LCGC14_1219830 [marine sediment metagenome]|uniref:Uncharacterized protein n=1 Tax=marine sediment metagenome TaxID=412755 RepID=A0A0F9NTX6_9ZZZZ